MKSIFTIIAIAAVTLSAQAQPVIDKLYDYKPGDVYMYKKLDPAQTLDTGAIPSVGANVTWDFTQVKFDNTVRVDSVLSPAQSMYPNSFPGCTYVYKEYIGIQQFYRRTADSVLYMGYSGSGGQEIKPNAPVIVFPAKYAASGNNVYSGANVNVPGAGVWQYNGRYNAYGTLKMPGNITITDVALYITQGGSTSMMFTDYMWAKAGQVDPLMRVQFMHIGANTSINLGYATVASLSVHGGLAVKNAIEVYPNPATDVLTVKSTGKIAQVRVCDLSGRILMQQAAGKQEVNVNISALAAGMYLLQVTTADGAVSNRSIVKQ